MLQSFGSVTEGAAKQWSFAAREDFTDVSVRLHMYNLDPHAVYMPSCRRSLSLSKNGQMAD